MVLFQLVVNKRIHLIDFSRVLKSFLLIVNYSYVSLSRFEYVKITNEIVNRLSLYSASGGRKVEFHKIESLNTCD
jgi:hypothetical protein